MSLAEQFTAFLITIGIGVAAACVYDLYRVVRLTLRLRRLGSGVGDLLFWLVLTAVVYGLLLLGIAGDVRWSVLAGLVIGALIYRRYLSDRGYRLWTSLGRVLRPVRRVAGYPFICLWVIASGPFRAPVRLFRAIGQRLFRRNRPPPGVS